MTAPRLVHIAADGPLAVVCVDGEPLEHIRGYSLQHSAGGLPQLTLDMVPGKVTWGGQATIEKLVDGNPLGYAVVTADNHFVGIYRNRESAEKVLARSPTAKGERIVEYVPR